LPILSLRHLQPPRPPLDAGVMCALELMRLDPANVDAKDRRLLGDWPIEIDLWVEVIQQQGLPESIKDL
jgi:hypothetical protein